MEIQKRKQAEEELENLQNHWHRLSHHLSLVGFSLPLPPIAIEDMGAQVNLDPAEELSRQIVVARSVADAVGRGCARAEVESKMESQISSKNFEIARLLDRLHYYEAANREMSRWNQEAVGEKLNFIINYFISFISLMFDFVKQSEMIYVFSFVHSIVLLSSHHVFAL